MGRKPGPLAGVRVLEIGQYIAAPTAGNYARRHGRGSGQTGVAAPW